MKLSSLKVDTPAIITKIMLDNATKRRIMSFGIAKNKIISLVKSNDSILLFAISNIKIALDVRLAKQIEITTLLA